MSLTAQIESNAYDENYHASENLALCDSQISTHKISDKSALSAVSWAAIIAGTTVLAALVLTLLLPGSGLGLSTVSLWAK